MALPSEAISDRGPLRGRSFGARGASNGGKTFHNRGGPYSATKGARRAIAVDIAGLPLAARVLPASLHENHTTAALLKDLAGRRQQERLELVLVDNGVTVPGARKLGAEHNLEARRVGHDVKPGTFIPLPFAWRVEVAPGRLLRHLRVARSFENTLDSASGWLQVVCLVAVLQALVSTAPRGRRRRGWRQRRDVMDSATAAAIAIAIRTGTH